MYFEILIIDSKSYKSDRLLFKIKEAEKMVSQVFGELKYDYLWEGKIRIFI